MIVTAVKFILQMIGLATIIWFVVVFYEEFRNILREEKKDGQ